MGTYLPKGNRLYNSAGKFVGVYDGGGNEQLIASLTDEQFANGHDPTQILRPLSRIIRPWVNAVVLGDSMEWIGSTGAQVVSNVMSAVEAQNVTATNYVFTARSVIQLACAQLGQRLRAISRGVSGERTDQWYARFDTDVTPYLPDVVIGFGGSNDIDQNKLASDIILVIKALHAKCKSIGAQFLFLFTSCGNFSSQANLDEAMKLHAMLQALDEQGDGFFYRPVAPAIINYSTDNGGQLGQPKAGMLKDSRHYAALGAYTASQVLVNFFSTMLPSGSCTGPICSNGLAGAGNQYSTLVRNGLFTSGVAAGAGTGSDPKFWASTKTGTITVDCSLAARTDGVEGQWAVHALSGAGAASDAVTLTCVNGNNTGLLAPYVGQVVVCQVDVDASCSSGTLSQLDLEFMINDTSLNHLTMGGANLVIGTEWLGYSTFKGTLTTKPFLVPANGDRPDVRMREGTSAGGAATVKWSRVNVRPWTRAF